MNEKFKKHRVERDEHRAKLEAKHGLTGHPKARRLYELAWDLGHSAGYSEVEIHYDDMADLLTKDEKVEATNVAATKLVPLLTLYIAFNRQASQCIDIAKWCDIHDAKEIGEALRDIATYLRDRAEQSRADANGQTPAAQEER